MGASERLIRFAPRSVYELEERLNALRPALLAAVGGATPGADPGGSHGAREPVAMEGGREHEAFVERASRDGEGFLLHRDVAFWNEFTVANCLLTLTLRGAGASSRVRVWAGAEGTELLDALHLVGDGDGDGEGEGCEAALAAVEAVLRGGIGAVSPAG